MSTSEYNPDCVVLPLSKGYTTIIDPEDVDLAKFKWYAQAKRKNVYAARVNPPVRKNKATILHRVILERILGRQLLETETVDHKNGCGLDNRRDNLRVATHSQNAANRDKNHNSQSVYKGIEQTVTGTYRAIIIALGKRIRLGEYNSPEEAAIAYNHAAKLHFGEFAYFNDIPDWETQQPVARVRFRSLNKRNTSGYPGVSYMKSTKKWRARITLDGKKMELGNFSTAELAYAAYLNAIEQHSRNIATT